MTASLEFKDTYILWLGTIFLGMKDEFYKLSLEVQYTGVTHCPLREIEAWPEVMSFGLPS